MKRVFMFIYSACLFTGMTGCASNSTTATETSNSIPATEAGLHQAIDDCSKIVINPTDASSADPYIADAIAANVASCINSKFSQFNCGPIAMADGSSGSLGDQVCTWEEYQIQGLRIITTDEYRNAMREAGSPYYQ